MPTSATPARYFTLPGGGKLRGDAAASYLRMRAAGMPAGGIDVFHRSLEKQAELFKLWLSGKGNRAAPPNANAPHYRGVAIDFHTTTGRIYDPSTSFLWATKGGKGQLKPQLGERLQAHAFGWRRTVPSERWHFAYDPDRDTKAKADLAARLKVLGFKTVRDFQRSVKLTADGVAGPATWTALLSAKPGPPKPPTPKPDVLRFATLNCVDPRFGAGSIQGAAQTRVLALAKVVASFDAPLIALTECPDDKRSEVEGKGMRTRLREALPGGAARWKVWVHGATAILFDSTVAKPVGAAGVLRSYFGTAGYHGAIAALFAIDGRKVAFCAYHLQPNSIASADAQIRQVQAAAEAARALTGAALRVLAGDGVNADSWLPGWQSTRVGKSADAPTYKGEAITDQIHVQADGKTVVKVTGYGTRPTKASDHAGVVAQVTSSVPSPL